VELARILSMYMGRTSAEKERGLVGQRGEEGWSELL